MSNLTQDEVLQEKSQSEAVAYTSTHNLRTLETIGDGHLWYPFDNDYAEHAKEIGIDTEQVALYLQPQSVKDMLEKAAKICESEGSEWDSDNQVTEKNYAYACRDAIRALIDQPAEQPAQSQELQAKLNRAIGALTDIEKAYPSIEFKRLLDELKSKPTKG